MTVEQKPRLCSGYKGGRRDDPISPSAQAALPPPRAAVWAGTELWPAVAVCISPVSESDPRGDKFTPGARG